MKLQVEDVKYKFMLPVQCILARVGKEWQGGRKLDGEICDPLFLNQAFPGK